MVRKTVFLGVMIAWAVILLSAMTLPAQDRMFTYDYSFKPGSEPDGFRGLKWQTDIATLDPLHTMEVIEIFGPFVYYKKNKEDLQLVTVKLDHIIYEFWNGKFSGVMIKVKGNDQFQILKDYVFARFGPGQRSKVLEQLNVQDFYYNGIKTRMYLKFSDIDRYRRAQHVFHCAPQPTTETRHVVSEGKGQREDRRVGKIQGKIRGKGPERLWPV